MHHSIYTCVLIYTKCMVNKLHFQKQHFACYRPKGTIADLAVKPFSSKHLCKHLKVLETVFST